MIYYLWCIMIVDDSLLMIYSDWPVIHTVCSDRHMCFIHTHTHTTVYMFREMHTCTCVCPPVHQYEISLVSFHFPPFFLSFLLLFLSFPKVTSRQLSFRWELGESKLWKTNRPIAFWVITQPVAITTVFQMATQCLWVRLEQLCNGCR